MPIRKMISRSLMIAVPAVGTMFAVATPVAAPAQQNPRVCMQQRADCERNATNSFQQCMEAARNGGAAAMAACRDNRNDRMQQCRDSAQSCLSGH